MLKQWYAVIVAGGTGSRFGGSRPKQFYLLESRPVLQWSIDAFFQCPSLTRLVVVSHPDWIEETGRIIRKQTFSDRITLVPGGSYRQDSCRNGLRSLPDEPDAPVLIHDAARPWINPELIMRILHAVPACRCVLPVLPITDSIVVTDHGMVIDYADRSRMGRVQTPQGFTLGLIRALHEQAESDGIKHALDDGSLALSAGYSIATVTGDPKNRKLTSPADLSSD